MYFGAVDAALRPYPVFTAVSALARAPAWLGPGYHQESHRALRYTGGWKAEESHQASLGGLKRGRPGDRVTFAFAGTALDLVVRRTPDAGRLAVRVDGAAVRATELPIQDGIATLDTRAPREEWQVRVPIARHLPPGRHEVTIEVVGGGTVDLDAVIVDGAPYAITGQVAWLIGSVFAAGAALGAWLGRRAA